MDRYKPVVIKDTGGKGRDFRADSCPLVEGVSSTGGTVGLYDSLDCALPGYIDGAIGISAEYKGLVYAVGGGSGVVLYITVGGFNEYHAEQLAQFTVIYLFCVAVLGYVLPEGIALEVIDGIGVNDADIMRSAALAGELARLGLL